MSFDLTKPVALDEKNYKTYRILQISLYFLALLFGVYFSFLILFPHQYFTFSFLAPNSSQNTLSKPAFSDGSFSERGTITTQTQPLIFNTPLVGDYSQVKIYLTPNQNSINLDSALVSARKTYQAFLYAEGEPIGFKDGSLLENNGNFYLISNGQLRKFENRSVLTKLSYSPENFKSVSSQELQYNSPGASIKNTDSYPDAALFKINDNYYLLENQKLKKFISESAFLTQYDRSQALEENPDFLNRYPLSDQLTGFADGTLVANGVSVYIINQNNLLPINNPITFENKGYHWEDLVYVSTDELASYERADLFRISNPHPDGTIFQTEDREYFMVANQKKHLLPSVDIAKSWLKKSPILVSKESLDFQQDCHFEKSFLSHSYFCEIPLENFKSLLGPEYEFQLTSSQNIQLDVINIDYAKNVGWKNFRASLGEIIAKIRLNYGLPASGQ